MPIQHNQPIGDKTGTIVSLGFKDVDVLSMIEPFDVLVLNYNPSKPKEKEKSDPEESEDTEEILYPTHIDQVKGEVVYFKFGSIESVETLIKGLENVRDTMWAINKVKRLEEIKALNKKESAPSKGKPGRKSKKDTSSED
ncbi:hypothetical protein [Telluribacter humicola]|uniref:hypothetical protein n=1 Tax=Telluribacter humicola TaxID=1720261 RepID=UPI001A95A660|nr:hypothetical protein [Telluribacter humicola]